MLHSDRNLNHRFGFESWLPHLSNLTRNSPYLKALKQFLKTFLKDCCEDEREPLVTSLLQCLTHRQEWKSMVVWSFLNVRPTSLHFLDICPLSFAVSKLHVIIHVGVDKQQQRCWPVWIRSLWGHFGLLKACHPRLRAKCHFGKLWSMSLSL